MANPSPTSTPFTPGIEARAPHSLASSLRSNWDGEPSPGGAPKEATSNVPPTVSPSRPARSISSIIIFDEAESVHLSGSSSTPSNDDLPVVSSLETCVCPMDTTRLITVIPTSPRRHLASAPAATRAAVSRALALSSTSRASRVPNFNMCKVAVTRAGLCLRLRAWFACILDRHNLAPVFPVTVLDVERNRAADSAPEAYLGHDSCSVFLDLHACAATIPELSSGKIPVDMIFGYRKPGRQTLDHHHQRGTVGFTCRNNTQSHRSPSITARTALTRTGGAAPIIRTPGSRSPDNQCHPNHSGRHLTSISTGRQ